MRHCLAVFLLTLSLLGCTPPPTAETPFSFHLFTEPKRLDPAIYRASSASYFFYNCLRGIYRLSAENKPVEEGGRCLWSSSKQLTCHLHQDQWSNGDPVTAQDYIRSFRHLVDPKTGSPRAHLLEKLAGAPAILQGQQPPTTLGVTAKDDHTLLFEFTQKDHEFLYKLASTALYPSHATHRFDQQNFLSFVVNGPYQVKSWTPGQKIDLIPNPKYRRGHPDRPPVRIFFIDDEMTAFRLYEKGQLSFLRRIPSQMIPKLKSRSDFFQQPMLRFDYIGFGKRLLPYPRLREALSVGADFEKLAVLLGALERPGCPSVPKTWLVRQTCLDFNPQRAKQLWQQLDSPLTTAQWHFKVSQLGGQDIKKEAEFLQNQWKNLLGASIQISQVEQKTFINELRSEPPDLFHKGVGLDRPTCLNALETFSSDSHQNFIQLQDLVYAKFLQQMEALAVDSKAYEELCQQAMDYLMNNHLLIPLGEIHFSLMASPRFKGWTLNGLNQLDLAQLHPSHE